MIPNWTSAEPFDAMVLVWAAGFSILILAYMVCMVLDWLRDTRTATLYAAWRCLGWLWMDVARLIHDAPYHWRHRWILALEIHALLQQTTSVDVNGVPR